MKYLFSIILTFFILTACLGVKDACAQVTTSSTSSEATLPTKAADVSDSQLRDLMQRAQASGMTDEQVRQAAIARGMPDSEANKLQSRINVIRSAKDANPASTDTKNIEGRQVAGDTSNTPRPKKVSLPTGPPIFGADIFNGSNSTFEPNLRIATPKNYRLGPDDQVVINVYGNSVADWKLNVNAEGNIAIPNIGLVNVSGKTIEQVTSMISARLLANNYAIGHGTSVAVSIGNIRSIKVLLWGELVRPGSYTLSSLSTVFNALYLSGGPNNIGSFRQIEVIRDNQVIRHLDIYDFILKGSRKDDIILQDGDIVRVPTYKVRVTMTGEIKRPAVYEVLPGESLRDVVNFAGGFTDVAFTASIKAIQLTDQDRKVTDIKASDLSNYIPLRGDQYIVEHILNSFENRVSIFGSVSRPGQFELDKNLTVSQLIAKASGLAPDAFTGRAFISRLRSDNSTELISFDARAILNKTAPDILLKKEDVVTIPSIFDLRDEYKVTINGEVRNQGDFPYAEKMTVEDLIVQAGGFAQGASPSRIEVARRINNSDPNQKNSPVSQTFSIAVDDQFKINSSSFVLQPFDMISVYSLPGYEKQRTVKIEGEVLYPGSYTITTKDEKISDLVKRAGGLTASADPDGGRLKRIDRLGIDAEKSKADVGEVVQERADRLAHIQKTLRDSTSNAYDQLKNDYVGIDLKKILSSPGSGIDLILEEGDILRIPKQQQLVKVTGQVLFPSSVVYEDSKGLRDFVSNAGGFSSDALKRKAYVVYANGSVKATHNFLFFKSYPEVRPGSELVIPKKPSGKGVSATELSSIGTALASVAAVLVGIITLTR